MSHIIYDAPDRSTAGRFWKPGAMLYRALGKARFACGAQSMTDALLWLERHAEKRTLPQVELWLHAAPGHAYINGEALNIPRLRESGTKDMLRTIGESIRKADGVFWIRGCSPFAGPMGHAFAETLCATMNCRVAGHTYLIGPWQSGLHTLSPGKPAYWDVTEGMINSRYGQATSMPWAPNTVSALGNKIPKGW